MLAVTLAEPATEANGSDAVLLTIADLFSTGARMGLADLGASDATETGPHYEGPVLTETGVDLFFGHYQEGQVLVPLEIEVAR